MRVIVQKFGGTSVATADGRENVVHKVKEAIENGFGVVVVVSAMGRNGDPYATDTLIGVARGVLKHIKPRELDLLMSCGENISTVVWSRHSNPMVLKPQPLPEGRPVLLPIIILTMLVLSRSNPIIYGNASKTVE